MTIFHLKVVIFTNSCKNLSILHRCVNVMYHNSYILVFYSSGQVFGKVDYLNPMDTRQYLYCLSPKPELYKDTKVLKGVTNIGKLDIVWKTNLGEKGRLQTSQLQRVVGTPLYEPSRENLSSGFPTRNVTNRAVQSQKMVRNLKFWI